MTNPTKTFTSALAQAWQDNNSLLCVGLDPDPAKFPSHLRGKPDAIFEFCSAIVDATADLACAFKPQIAYFAANRAEDQLEALIARIHERHPGIPVILDAKRGDIGNTSRLYAKAFFEQFSFDAVTVAPYMGRDSVAPFLEFPGKWAIVLALTSNAGSADFQFTPQENGAPLYDKVIRSTQQWGSPDNLMFVVGATHPEQFAAIRKTAPGHFLLVPGVGAQGGDLAEVCRYGMTDEVGLLINASRAILYAGSGRDFAERARAAALELQREMAGVME